MFIWTSNQYTCPGNYSVMIDLNGFSYDFTSLGWQNSGNAYQFYPSQMFIKDDLRGAYLQFVNLSGSSVDFWVKAAMQSGDSGKEAVEIKQPEPEVEIHPIE